MMNFKFGSDQPLKRSAMEKEEAMAHTPHETTEDSEDKVTTVIADDLDIKGTIRFKNSLMIKGALEGEIISEGLLIIGPTARVSAIITTNNLISHGEIKGDVIARERVILKSTAVHTGNITTPNIVIESGSFFNGSCIMRKESVDQLPDAITIQAAVEESAPPEEIISETETFQDARNGDSASTSSET